MKSIVIFGATSAIAQATARIWAQQGIPLLLVARNPQKLRAIAEDLRGRGATKVETLEADLDAADSHRDLWRKILDRMPQLDGVLIAWGELGEQPASEADPARARAILHTNFLSPASLLTCIANDLEKRPGACIGVITSVAGDRGRRSNYVYASAKGGLSTFLSGLRARLFRHQVSVIDLRPGFTDTPMTAKIRKSALTVSPEKVARGIVRAFQRRAAVAYLPGFWRLILFVIRSLPEAIFKRLSF